MKILKLTILVGLGLLTLNANAVTGLKGSYYLVMNGGVMSQSMRQTYVETTNGGFKGDFRKTGMGPLMQVGMGYNILDDLRIDAVLHYDKGAKSKVKTIFGVDKYSLKARETSIGALANLYYDLSVNTKFMPYVMGGVGFMKNTIRTQYENSLSKKGSASKGLSKMAYQFGFGMNIHLGKHWDMDLGFRMINKGQKKKKKNDIYSQYVDVTFTDTNSKVYTKPSSVRALMIGLKRDF